MYQQTVSSPGHQQSQATNNHHGSSSSPGQGMPQQMIGNSNFQFANMAIGGAAIQQQPPMNGVSPNGPGVGYAGNPAPAHVYYTSQNQHPQQMRQGYFADNFQPMPQGSAAMVGKNSNIMLQKGQIHFQPNNLNNHHQQARMQQYPHGMPMQAFGNEHYQQMRDLNGSMEMVNSGQGVHYSGQSVGNDYQARSNLGIMGSPVTNSGSHKVSQMSGSIGAFKDYGSSARVGARSKQLNSSTTGESTGNERRSSLLGTSSPGQFKESSNAPSCLTAAKDQEFQKIKKHWDPITPQRQKMSLSPSMMDATDRNLASPAATTGLQYGTFNQQQVSATVDQNERKRFVRKRVNTKTPSRKSTSVILYTTKMSWDVARELTDLIGKIVTSDQIKSCNMELQKNQVKVQLASVDAANKVIASLNERFVQEQKVTAYKDISDSVLASPNAGANQPTSSSPPQINLNNNQRVQQLTSDYFSQEQLIHMSNMALMQQQPGQQQVFLDQSQNQLLINQQARQNKFLMYQQQQMNAGHEIAANNHNDSMVPGEGLYMDKSAPTFAQTQPNQQQVCNCCMNGHPNMRMQHSHSNASVSSPIENFHPSGGTSSYDKNSFMKSLNRSPNMIRTLENPMRNGFGGINKQSTGSEQNARAGNAGLDVMCRHSNSQNFFVHNFHGHYPQTPSSNQRSSNNTKSASGSQNASSTKLSNRTATNEPVKIELVKQGKDLRTYLCVKNLPCRYTKQNLRDEINVNHRGRYTACDIIADKKEPKKMTNMGYFFIDFKHPLFVVDFFEEYQGRMWESHNSDKKVMIFYGRSPKKECHNGHKLDANLVSELHQIVAKYNITTPLDQFQRQPQQAKNADIAPISLQSHSHVAVSGFNQQPQFITQVDQVQKSLSQVNLSTSGHMQPQDNQFRNNYPIAEEDQEQVANEMSDEKVRK